MNTIETIEWKSVKDEKPDTETTVLLFAPNQDEPVWPGFWDSALHCWRHVDGTPAPGRVTHWAQFPAGPSNTF